MKQPDIVALLIRKSEQDEKALRTLLSDPEIDTEILGFHAQQAIEKLLKAWLCHSGIDYPKNHQLGLLLELAQANHLSFPDSLNDVILLSPFATVFRYDALPLDADMDRHSLLQLVEQVRSFVLSKTEMA